VEHVRVHPADAGLLALAAAFELERLTEGGIADRALGDTPSHSQSLEACA
jgi:hypothetical protein